jgi:endonuclease/exonuclease/phosphatase family metal-dependent hydrolase
MMRGRVPRRAAAVVSAVTLVVASGLMVAPRPADAAGSIRVMQYNFCGAICNKGVVAKAGVNNDVVEDIRNRVVAFRPHLVMLHEACEGQVDRLKSLLQGSAWPMGGVFRAQRSDGRCTGAGRGFGDAVLTAGPVGARQVLDLPDRGKEDRAILCLNTDAGGPVLACALHLVTGKGKPGKDELSQQLAATARMLNAKAASRAVVTGGDFNVSPGRMGELIDSTRGGRFFDIDPEKAGTWGNKIDYVLFSRSRFSGPSGGPVKSKYSDHKLLLGSTTRN